MQIPKCNMQHGLTGVCFQQLTCMCIVAFFIFTPSILKMMPYLYIYIYMYSIYWSAMSGQWNRKALKPTKVDHIFFYKSTIFPIFYCMFYGANHPSCHIHLHHAATLPRWVKNWSSTFARSQLRSMLSCRTRVWFLRTWTAQIQMIRGWISYKPPMATTPLRAYYNWMFDTLPTEPVRLEAHTTCFMIPKTTQVYKLLGDYFTVAIHLSKQVADSVLSVTWISQVATGKHNLWALLVELQRCWFDTSWHEHVNPWKVLSPNHGCQFNVHFNKGLHIYI